MGKKAKTVEKHLETIEYLLAGIILKRDVDIKQMAKIIKCSDKTLTAMYPEKKKGKKHGKNKKGKR